MRDQFRADVLANRNNRVILDRWSTLALPDSWLVAGCLFQTVWNLQAGRPPEENIKDYDLFYAALYEGVLAANPLTPYPDLFDQKTASYCARWPFLRVVRPLNAAVS